MQINDEAETQERFEKLQRKLVPLWRSIRAMGEDEQTIVVVPSMTVDKVFPGAVQQAYEERFLFLLFLLRQPRARMVYVTSLAIAPAVIDYYLGLLPGVIASHARRRLFLVSPLDPSSRPLSLKLLGRPELLERIRGLIPDPDRAHLVPFNTTAYERDVAVALGIPMYGCDPKHFHLGTKSGCRRIFAELGVDHPLGAEGLTTEDDLAGAIAEMRARKPSIAQVIVKLNEGVSGEGNAIVDLSDLAGGGSGTAIRSRIRGMRFDTPSMTHDGYMAKLRAVGGVAEERIAGDDFRSPSAQLRISPLGEVERLSTHDQILGGPSGQLYMGCRFPADPAYAAAIMRDAARVGSRLAEEGVIGRFALDFVAVREPAGDWKVYAIEINLRKGGTTHPYLTLQFLTDGVYDPEAGRFLAPSGREKFFVASDDVESPAYRRLTPDDLFDIAVCRRLHFEPTRQTGVVFHMMSALGECGRVGLTAVADTIADADVLFKHTVAALDVEAARRA
ncbi:MAG TPA: peptide ligase PGM1-related protein [Candidatus Polarisedimenticolaceae bacterium]|nr:peptide ligase PGM1-related protein [Candidatus Polarisedimenticolaceae bacterium]